jgi:predicted transcriptional regulator
VEYRFPNRIPFGSTPSEIEFSAEICSEAPYHKNDWPSDITLWVNQQDIGTWTSPGDFGGERGFHTPKWWSVNFTQFGLLKNWKINDEGTFLDGVKLSDVKLKELNIMDKPFISLRFGIKEDALNAGGLNIFGREFGNYRQAIIMNVKYINKNE